MLQFLYWIANALLLTPKPMLGHPTGNILCVLLNVKELNIQSYSKYCLTAQQNTASEAVFLVLCDPSMNELCAHSSFIEGSHLDP